MIGGVGGVEATVVVVGFLVGVGCVEADVVLVGVFGITELTGAAVVVLITTS